MQLAQMFITPELSILRSRFLKRGRRSPGRRPQNEQGSSVIGARAAARSSRHAEQIDRSGPLTTLSRSRRQKEHSILFFLRSAATAARTLLSRIFDAQPRTCVTPESAASATREPAAALLTE